MLGCILEIYENFHRSKGDNMYKSSVVSAISSDMERSIATIVMAFTLDPLMRWMLPEPRQYLVYLPKFLRFFAGGAFDHASAYRSEDFNAAAMWLPPGISPDKKSLAQVMQEAVAPALQDEVFALFGKVEAAHPDTEHWYLPTIGVDPLCQGKGYGSALLSCGLEICDRNHVAAYLESTNPKNIPLYQRFGFEIVGKIQAGSSPAITPMFRAVR
jgi:ribosomal protein S18 acetylase RimI-like enzyme